MEKIKKIVSFTPYKKNETRCSVLTALKLSLDLNTAVKLVLREGDPEYVEVFPVSSVEKIEEEIAWRNALMVKRER